LIGNYHFARDYGCVHSGMPSGRKHLRRSRDAPTGGMADLKELLLFCGGKAWKSNVGNRWIVGQFRDRTEKATNHEGHEVSRRFLNFSVLLRVTSCPWWLRLGKLHRYKRLTDYGQSLFCWNNLSSGIICKQIVKSLSFSVRTTRVSCP
jgi:hypothetical protein